MKFLLQIIYILLVLTGCQNLSLIDEMEPWSDDTDSGYQEENSTSDSAASSNEIGIGDVSSMDSPQQDEGDLIPPLLKGECGEYESENEGVCISYGPLSALIQFETDEGAEIGVSLENGENELMEVLSSKWGTEHSVLISKLSVAEEVLVEIDVSDVNNNSVKKRLPIVAKNEQSVVITEVLADPVGDEPVQEFVEIMNVSSEVIDLSGWMIDDNGDSNGDIIGEGLMINPFEKVVVASDDFVGSSNLHIAIGSSIGTSGLKNSESESIELFDKYGLLMAQFSSTLQPKEGISIERNHLYLPDNSAITWRYNLEESSSPGI